MSLPILSVFDVSEFVVYFKEKSQSLANLQNFAFVTNSIITWKLSINLWQPHSLLRVIARRKENVVSLRKLKVYDGM